MPFGERAISQLFKLKGGGDCSEFEKLQKNPYFEEIATELTGGRQGEWQSTIGEISQKSVKYGSTF